MLNYIFLLISIYNGAGSMVDLVSSPLGTVIFRTGPILFYTLLTMKGLWIGKIGFRLIDVRSLHIRSAFDCTSIATALPAGQHYFIRFEFCYRLAASWSHMLQPRLGPNNATYALAAGMSPMCYISIERSKFQNSRRSTGWGTTYRHYCYFRWAEILRL